MFCLFLEELLETSMEEVLHYHDSCGKQEMEEMEVMLEAVALEEIVVMEEEEVMW